MATDPNAPADQTASPDAPDQPDWQQVLAEGDEDAFRRLVEPHIDSLRQLAEHDLTYYVEQDMLHERDFTPEEVIGETLIQLWGHRERRPEALGLHAWLHGALYRTLRGMVEQQRAYRAEKALSLDEPIPPDRASYDTQEWFWDWYQPRKGLLTWEDVTPATAPVDTDGSIALEDQLSLLDPDRRLAALLHDVLDTPIPEVSVAMGRAVNEVAELVEEARASFRERLLTADPTATDHPAPPDGI